MSRDVLAPCYLFRTLAVSAVDVDMTSLAHPGLPVIGRKVLDPIEIGGHSHRPQANILRSLANGELGWDTGSDHFQYFS